MSLSDRIRKCCLAGVVAASLFFPAPAGARLTRRPASNNGYFNFVYGSFDKKYDNHNMFHKDSLEEMLNSTHKVYGHITVEVTRFSYEGNKSKKSVTESIKTATGSAVVIENDNRSVKLLTCNHCVTLPKFKDQYDPQKRPLVKYRVKDVHFVLEEKESIIPEAYQPLVGVERFSTGPELRVIARDSAHDLAVVQTKKRAGDWIKRYKPWNRWGNSSELEPGDFVYVLGYSNDRGKHLFHGYMSSDGVEASKNDDYYFYIDGSVNKGNSGGPVFALRDGKPELVGITRSKIPDGMAGVVRIDYAKKLLRRVRLGRILRGREYESRR
ncbi:serine protease [Candidatus Woesearchaeota archaeon]|nr:serine protease [Candidatus Woesearchaeota archaeon]